MAGDPEPPPKYGLVFIVSTDFKSMKLTFLEVCTGLILKVLGGWSDG